MVERITVADALLARQAHLDLTQAQMARQLGIAPSVYNHILHGRRRLPYTAACRAFSLGVAAEILLSLDALRPAPAHHLLPAPEPCEAHL